FQQALSPGPQRHPFFLPLPLTPGTLGQFFPDKCQSFCLTIKDRVGESPLVSLAGVETTPEQNDMKCPFQADDARQPLGPSPTWHQTKFNLRQTYLRARLIDRHA